MLKTSQRIKWIHQSKNHTKDFSDLNGPIHHKRSQSIKHTNKKKLKVCQAAKILVEKQKNFNVRPLQQGSKSNSLEYIRKALLELDERQVFLDLHMIYYDPILK